MIDFLDNTLNTYKQEVCMSYKKTRFSANLVWMNKSHKNQILDSVDSDSVDSDSVVYENVVPEASNGAGSNVGVTQTTFVPTSTVDVIARYSGQVISNTGGISIGTTLGGTDIFVSSPPSGDGDGARLTLTRQENFSPSFTLIEGTTYHIGQWAGGGGLIFNHTVIFELV